MLLEFALLFIIFFFLLFLGYMREELKSNLLQLGIDIEFFLLCELIGLDMVNVKVLAGVIEDLLCHASSKFLLISDQFLFAFLTCIISNQVQDLAQLVVNLFLIS